MWQFDYLKERKDTWEILFEELLVWIGKGEVVESKSLKTAGKGKYQYDKFERICQDNLCKVG